VFDPFLGAGTAIIAAEQHGRRGYGMELQPAYVDIAITRWEKATGRTAELLERVTDAEGEAPAPAGPALPKSKTTPRNDGDRWNANGGRGFTRAERVT
jgi:hypothetical protein